MLNNFRMFKSFVERYNLDRDPEVMEILEILAVVDDPDIERDLQEYIIEKHRDQLVNPNPFLPHPPAEAIAGEVPIGLTELGHSAGINLDELQQGGIAIFGRSGSGKTITAANISNALVKKYPDRVALWFFETVKKTFRHIMPDDTLIIPYKRDRFNSLREPPGADYQDWQFLVCELLAQTFGLRQAGLGMLFEVVEELNHLYGIHKGSGIRPTLIEVYSLMLAKREKYLSKKDMTKVSYVDRWSNKLFMFTTALRDVVSCDAGYPLELLINRNVIWELVGLDTTLQTFFINAKLLWKMEYKKANPGKAGKLAVNVFDEGGRVFARSLYEE